MLKMLCAIKDHTCSWLYCLTTYSVWTILCFLFRSDAATFSVTTRFRCNALPLALLCSSNSTSWSAGSPIAKPPDASFQHDIHFSSYFLKFTCVTSLDDKVSNIKARLRIHFAIHIRMYIYICSCICFWMYPCVVDVNFRQVLAASESLTHLYLCPWVSFHRFQRYPLTFGTE